MRKLSLFGRSCLLIGLELLANIVCWIFGGILFGRHRDTRGILSLCLLAWTLGLRHALDADHISAIDNATRGLINLGQLPVTCGLYFSLGHSTIVIVVNVVIAISTDIYDKIGSVGTVGAIVGSAVSGSFLFLVGLANSIILWRIIQQRRREKSIADAEKSASPLPAEHLAISSTVEEQVQQTVPQGSFMMRILGPVVRCVDKPWKMYPVGVLFGFGFDTASSIALLAVSAIAKRDSNGQASIRNGDVIILPLLFTAGMTLVDSADSILMLYSYAGFPESGFAFFTCSHSEGSLDKGSTPVVPRRDMRPRDASADANTTAGKEEAVLDEKRDAISTMDASEAAAASLRVKQNTMSGLSIVLTLISIVVAFSISVITLMGLIGNVCHSCSEAASAPDGGGVAGRWWRGWAKANDQSGLIGAVIVGGFVALVSGFYAVRHAQRRWMTPQPEDV
ncbi:hypothetical protein FRB95_007647 [Tulasnella sp. JGI-2019a]|nr:hypothetical protein FRB95_007647 [Tulasnella sp. JGI-2019a]